MSLTSKKLLAKARTAAQEAIAALQRTDLAVAEAWQALDAEEPRVQREVKNKLRKVGKDLSKADYGALSAAAEIQDAQGWVE